MNLRPTSWQNTCLCLIIMSFLFIFSCSKDEEAKTDTTVATEQRITAFSPIQDAYLQDGQGFNGDEIHMAKDLKSSYLMFDLSQIKDIGASIVSANLQFIINEGEGSGTIEVYKGMSNDWFETNLKQESAPETGAQLGMVRRDYGINESISIDLDIAQLPTEKATLVLYLTEGSSFAFASKENTTIAGSELVVVYNAPEDTETISSDNTDSDRDKVADEDETSEGDETSQGGDTPNIAESKNIDCSVSGGKAGDTGEKIWCWGDNAIPEYSGSAGVYFSDNEFKVNSECDENQVSNDGDQINFRINPLAPAGNWCRNDFNMRAEISTQPHDVQHALGTEEWFGWSYSFGDDYVIDENNKWLFFQLQQGVSGSPPISFYIQSNYSALGETTPGEFWIMNFAASATQDKYTKTNIIPVAGQTLNLVVHVVHGEGDTGLLEVWESGNLLYSKQVRTVHHESPWGGHAKFGIYKWPWKTEAGIQASVDGGVSHVETSMGTLRMITRRPGDADYMKDSYDRVAPD